ncbi:MAG: hypothetical protein Hals2KO_40030 [Halioglobus sp.]
MVAAGLQGDVRGGTRCITGAVQRFDFGMITPGRLGKALTDNVTFPDQDTADVGVGRGPELALARQL